MRLAAIAIAALALSTTAQAAPAERGSVEHGRQLVTRNCAGCHAVGPRGDSPNPLSPPFRELNKRYPVETLAEALAEGILTGHPAMPEFMFPAPDVEDIIAYLKSVQTRGSARAGAGQGAQAPVT